MSDEKARTMGTFEKNLTFLVLFCMILGTLIGYMFPGMAAFLDSLAIAQVNIPIGILLFFMIYPIMLQIDFQSVTEAIKSPKPVITTLVINWGIKPFTMTFFAWLFMQVIWANFISTDLAQDYIAGMILLGIAPCTAMVFVWSYLSDGNMGHTLVMVAVNSLTMLFLYAPLGTFLLGVTDIPIPFLTLFLTVGLYVGVPLVAGYLTRAYLIKNKGIDWFENVYVSKWGNVSQIALLVTLVSLFVLQGQVIITQPVVIVLIAIPLIIQTFTIFAIGYVGSRYIGIEYPDAAPTAQIGASNHFEVAIAVASMLFGIDSGAALATVVGVLIEVPIMLALVRICLKTRYWFRDQQIKMN